MILLRTLGTLSVRTSEGDALGSVSGRSKRLALLVYLAAARPAGPRRRDALLALFWPEADDARARGALRQSLKVLHDALGDGALLGLGSDAVACNPSRVWCDAAAFDVACDAGRYAEALRLYLGEFLPGFSIPEAPDFDSWMTDMRQRLQTRAASAAAILADEATSAGDLTPASQWAAKALDLAPDDEGALVRLIVLLDRQGQRALALDAYERCAARLERDLGVQLSAATQQLGRALRLGGRRAHEPGMAALRVPTGRPSVAVLPLLNLSGDVEFEYFCDGMTEELIADLASVPGLSVAARTSSFAFKGRNDDVRRIGARLGVEHVIEGSIRRDAERIRITVQIIDAGSGFHEWADTFEYPLAQAVRVPEEIARRLAPALGKELSAPRHRRASRESADRDAYLLFLRGQFHLYKRSPSDLKKAQLLFEQAITRDPAYAAAYGGLANALVALPVYCGVPTADCLPRALDVAATALSLDPNLAGAHSARSLALAMYTWNWEESETSALRALETDPQDVVLRSVYAFYVLAASGRFDEALAEARRARDADPLSLPANAYVGYVGYLARRYGVAEHAARAALELHDSFPLARWVLEMTLEELGRLDEAVSHARALASSSGGSPMFEAHLARALARAGARTDARALLTALETSLPEPSPVWYWLAGVYGALGETELGMECLEKAVLHRSNFLVFVGVHPTLDPLRAHPRFADVLTTVLGPDNAAVTLAP
jgi:TolB-like protein/DNA-binding SARP family transcriptional activator